MTDEEARRRAAAGRFNEPIFSENSVVYNARGEIVNPPPGPKRERALAVERAWSKYWDAGDESELVELGILKEKDDAKKSAARAFNDRAATADPSKFLSERTKGMTDEEARRYRAAAARFTAPMFSEDTLIYNARGEIVNPPPGPKRERALAISRAWREYWASGDDSGLVEVGLFPKKDESDD